MLLKKFFKTGGAIVIGILILSLGIWQELAAVTAPLRPVRLQQPDGTIFYARITGDEYYRHIETIEGYTIIHDLATDSWFYATLDAQGELVSSGQKVGRDQPTGLAMQIQPAPARIAQIRANRLPNPLQPIFRAPLPDRLKGNHENFTAAPPVTGVGKPLVILADFAAGTQTAHVYTKANFETSLFSENTYPSGSLNDYFQEVSYGVFSVQGTVTEWTTAPQTYTYYCNGQSGMSSWPRNSQRLVYDLVTSLNSSINFAQYDQDQDGYVDCVTIIFEGTADGSNNEFWPHAWSLGSYSVLLDGVRINRFNLVNEQTDAGLQNAIGTFCHEYSHVLGAPDLYDYDDGSYRVRDNDGWPVGFWCLMSNGNYGYSPDGVEAACPTHICGFVKYQFLGWLTPTEINSQGTYTIKASELNHDTQTIYKIPVLSRSDEYFFLENHDPASTARFNKRDGFNQPLDAGLIIMHIDEELPIWTSGRYNNGKPSDSWYRVWVEDLAEPSNLAISPYETKCQAAFAAEDPQIEFTPTTTPYNSNANDGSVSNIYINAISHSGATMTFHYGPQTATMIVTAPNGGENWQIGQTYAITWNATNTTGNVKIEISRNNGTSWTNIVTSTPDNGTYFWTVTAPAATACRIRISDTDGSPTDMSDGPFTISTEPWPEITINPTSWDFGTVNVGNLVEKIFVISNIGAANLDVYSTTLTSPNAAEFSILSGAAPFTLSPTATSNLVIRFTPLSAGSKSAVLTIAHNDAAKNPSLINLSAVAESTPAIGWQVPLTLVGGSSSYTCNFGGAMSATDGFDLGVDKICPPPGMTYYAFFSIASLPYFLEQDIRPWVAPYSTPIDWSLMIVNATGFTTALSWDPSSLPANGSFVLTGGGLNVDLRAQNSATVTGDVNLMIQYRPHITTGFTFPNAGWYLISLPVAPSNNALSALFPTALSAFSYEPGNSIYLPATNLEPQKGYWLLIPGATTANISGIAVTSFTEHYQMGWHLLGAVKGVVNFVNPNDNPDGAVIAAYGWEPNSQQYFSVYPSGTAQLNEGQGYWLAVLQPCDLTLSSTGSFQKEAPTLKATTAFVQKFGLLPPSPPFQTQSSLATTVLPEHTVLRNYPNPFNPTTEIEYFVLKAGPVQLEIYNALGQKIRTLTSTVQTPGVYHVTWDGTNETGANMANGLYFTRLTTASGCQLWKIMLLR